MKCTEPEPLKLRVSRGLFCGPEEETGLHVICDCPKFSQLRRMFSGSYVMQPTEVIRLGLLDEDFRRFDDERECEQRITRSVF